MNEGRHSSDVLSRPLSEAMQDLYRRLDAEIARFQVSCDACGRCCHFSEFDHVLYLSRLEALYLFRRGAPRTGDTRVCPFLNEGGCGARSRRALGCRTFFCDRRDRDSFQSLYETYHREMRALSERFGIEWRYAPLAEQIQAMEKQSVAT